VWAWRWPAAGRVGHQPVRGLRVQWREHVWSMRGMRGVGMIRRGVIVVLTLASLAMLVLEVASFACRSPYPWAEPWRWEGTRYDVGSSMLTTALRLPGSDFGGAMTLPHSVQGALKLSDLGERGILGIYLCRGRFAVGYVDLAPTQTIRRSSSVVTLDGRLLAFENWWVGLPKPAAPLHVLAVRGASWVPLALLAAYPAVAFVCGPVRRWRRRRKGRCVRCGYDLTGNVSGVCPECGERR